MEINTEPFWTEFLRDLERRGLSLWPSCGLHTVAWAQYALQTAFRFLGRVRGTRRLQPSRAPARVDRVQRMSYCRAASWRLSVYATSGAAAPIQSLSFWGWYYLDSADGSAVA